MQNLKELTGQQKYDLLRSEYKDFIFDSYEVEKNSNELDIKYNLLCRTCRVSSNMEDINLEY